MITLAFQGNIFHRKYTRKKTMNSLYSLMSLGNFPKDFLRYTLHIFLLQVNGVKKIFPSYKKESFVFMLKVQHPGITPKG